MEKKILIKAPLKEEFLQNEVREQVRYISIPEDCENYSAEQSVKSGGLQFEEVSRLTKKKKLSRVIAITADSEEMGFMAISYLAMEQLKRRGGCLETRLSDCREEKKNWTEAEDKIPIIKIDDLMSYRRRSVFPFEGEGYLTAQSQSHYHHRPFWQHCTRCAVCVVVYRSSVDSNCLESIHYFANNSNVYVLFIDKNKYEAEMMEEAPFGCMDSAHFTAMKNNYILSNAADSVNVSMGESDGKQYYSNILKQNLQQRGIKVKRNFSYDRVIHLAAAVNKESVCETINKIICYALKDVEETKSITLDNKAFDFVDYFIREQNFAGKIEDGRKLMEQNLIGIEEIKQQVYDIINVMKYNKLRSQMNISESKYHNVHVMLGAPGTAKTTVAQYMGQMMFQEKLLPDNRFICINGAELKGMYVGHSAPKTKTLFESYDVIIIDEAYSIVEAGGETDSFGNEAIAQLIIELEKHSQDKLVIFAGYGGDAVSEKDNRMTDFLNANPGIKSRITSTFYFKSYTPDQMVQIFMRIAKNCSYVVEAGTEELLYSFFAEREKERDFGNGREARALLETAVVYAAKRVMASEKTEFSKKDMTVLTKNDIYQAIEKMRAGFGSRKTAPRRMGFVC